MTKRNPQHSGVKQLLEEVHNMHANNDDPFGPLKNRDSNDLRADAYQYLDMLAMEIGKLSRHSRDGEIRSAINEARSHLNDGLLSVEAVQKSYKCLACAVTILAGRPSQSPEDREHCIQMTSSVIDAQSFVGALQTALVREHTREKFRLSRNIAQKLLEDSNGRNHE